jgi:hypothetical protein
VEVPVLSRALSITAVSVLAAAGAAAPAAADSFDGSDLDRGGQGLGVRVHTVDLDPLNDSGVEGHAVLIQRGDQLRAIVVARGLTPGQVHPQHIHGLEGDTEAVCPPESAQDDLEGLPEEAEDPDEFLALEEGLPFYGPILQPLEPFPVANRAGVVTYSETFTVEGDLEDLTDEHVVLHGMFLGDQYAATLPVACGPID